LRRALLAAVASAALSCAPTYAEGYEAAFSAGLRAQNAGRWEEAAKHFAEAGALGERYKDRDEARLLQAEALEKLGKDAEAEALYRRIEREAGGRYQGQRAAYALGRLVWETKGFEAGSKELLGAVRKYPSHGMVRHALKRMIQHVEDEKGPEAAWAWFEPIAKSLEGTQAEEAATYEKGGLLARVGKKDEAVSVLLAQARKYRYPNGSLTDDAYYVASLFLEDLGKNREAIDVLVEMLKPMEAAYGGASYRRPRFPQGQYRIAVLYRDRFKDRERAKREFWRVYTDHETARQTDDALWQKARLEREDGQQKEACATLETLLAKKKDSRYVRCVRLLCPTLPAGDKPCPAYVEEAVTGNAPEPAPETE
jgi:tetratricopeptide (TPR) repeat protein